MRNWIVSALGGVLIFGTHQLAPLLSPADVEVVIGENAGGVPDFALLLSRWSWWALTFQNDPNIKTLSDRSRATLRPIVNTALERAGLRCPDGWTLTDTFDLSAGHRIGVAGYCWHQGDRT